MKSLFFNFRLALGLAALAVSASAQIVSLDTFDFNATTGAELAGSSWEGNISYGATSITVGGSAQSDNGWGTYSTFVDATDMAYLAVTAQLTGSHDVGALFTIQFEDMNLNTSILAFSTSDLSFDGLTTLYVPLAWSEGFDLTQITGWTIGGGDPSPGFLAYGLTLEDLSLTASAIPEPGTYALWLGAAAACYAVVRRRTRAPSAA